MNSRIPQQSQMYEKRRDMESNNIAHSNLRFDSSSGYRWLSSNGSSGSAVALGTGVSVGGGSVGNGVSVGASVSVGGTTVGVSEGTTGSVGATVFVAVGDGWVVGVRFGGVSTGED